MLNTISKGSLGNMLPKVAVSVLFLVLSIGHMYYPFPNFYFQFYSCPVIDLLFNFATIGLKSLNLKKKKFFFFFVYFVFVSNLVLASPNFSNH